MKSRFELGWEKLQEVDGEVGKAVVESLQDVAPDLGKYVIEFAFGDVYSRPGLDLKTRELVTVAALTAMGNCQPQLKVHINGALNVGCKKEEIVETIIQMAAYAGLPSALNGITMLKEVLLNRKTQ
jgi:4-carboxymuconolactone decarboxylase